MAYTVTIQSVIDRAKTHADMKSSGFISPAEGLAMFNEAYAELYDELVGSFENYFATDEDITIVPGQDMYALPDDFYKLLGVDFQVNNNAYITLKPFDEAERNVTLTTNINIPSGTIKLRYVPAAEIFTDPTVSVDFINGWDRLLSLLMGIDMLDAEESESGALSRKYARTLQRVRDMAAPRDAGMPATIADVFKPNIQYIYGALRYRLYGTNVRFINTEFIGADLYPSFV